MTYDSNPSKNGTRTDYEIDGDIPSGHRLLVGIVRFPVLATSCLSSNLINSVNTRRSYHGEFDRHQSTNFRGDGDFVEDIYTGFHYNSLRIVISKQDVHPFSAVPAALGSQEETYRHPSERHAFHNQDMLEPSTSSRRTTHS